MPLNLNVFIRELGTLKIKKKVILHVIFLESHLYKRALAQKNKISQQSQRKKFWKVLKLVITKNVASAHKKAMQFCFTRTTNEKRTCLLVFSQLRPSPSFLASSFSEGRCYGKAIFQSVNQFHTNDLFLQPLKTSDNLWLSYVLWGYRKRSVVSRWYEIGEPDEILL